MVRGLKNAMDNHTKQKIWFCLNPYGNNNKDKVTDWGWREIGRPKV